MAAPGGRELSTLIKSMNPVLATETFVWVTFPSVTNEVLASLLPVADMLFREQEGWTAILPRAAADERHLDYVFPSKKITLNVHSSLEAVGFIAAISARLTAMNIGSNPVSAYFHDHLYIPEGKEETVIKALQTMAAEM
jgi:uncharacterized protein